MTVSHFPWFLWPWQLWRLLVKCFVECPSIGVCLMFSFLSMIRLGFCVWGRILQRWSVHHHVVSVVSTRLFTAKWPFIPLHIVFLGSESLSPAPHKGREVKLHLLEREYRRTFLGILLQGGFQILCLVFHIQEFSKWGRWRQWISITVAQGKMKTSSNVCPDHPSSLLQRGLQRGY